MENLFFLGFGELGKIVQEHRVVMKVKGLHVGLNLGFRNSP